MISFQLRKRISAKMAAMSGIGMLIVVVALIAVWTADRSVEADSNMVVRQLTISRDIVDAKASSRGMTTGFLELRLAKTPADAKDASSYFMSRYASFSKYVEAAASAMTLQANKDRAAQAMALSNDLVAAFNKLSSLTDARLSSGSPPTNSEDGLQVQMIQLSDQIGKLLDATVDAAKSRATEADASLRSSQMLALVILCISGFLVTIVLMASAMFGAKAIARPITLLTARMGSLAEGDLDGDIPLRERGDEIGEMARAVQVFRENGIKVREMTAQEASLQAKSTDLQNSISSVVAAAAVGDFTQRITKDYEEPDLNRFAASVNALVTSVDAGVGEVRQVVAALAQGDLTKEMQGEFRGAFAELQHNINQALNSLRGTLSEVRSATDTIRAGSGALRQAADDLSKRTEKQAASLEETSAALEEITSAVGSSTERASEARHLVDEAHRSTTQSSQVVTEAITAMQRIEQASGEISKITNVIDEIAFQTNLLALNAGVEAARAGDAGKGFAVVAQEVRELAQRSAAAAKDIKALIARSRSEVDAGVKLVTETGSALSLMEGHVAKINNDIRFIADAAKEQSSGLKEVNTAINDMDQVTQQNAAMVEETTADTNKLAEEVATLAAMVSRFKLDRQEAASAIARRAA